MESVVYGASLIVPGVSVARACEGLIFQDFIKFASDKERVFAFKIG